jgi:phage tail-like protein
MTLDSSVAITQQSSLSSIFTDPIRNFKYHVEFVPASGMDFGTLGFMGVSVGSMEIEALPYRQGGSNTSPQMMPLAATFDPIVLSKGVIPGDSKFLSWYNQIFSLLQGAPAFNGTVGNSDFRAIVNIMIIDHPATTTQARIKALLRVWKAWPSKLTLGDLNASDNSVWVQQITLRHEGWTLYLPSQPGSTIPAGVL